MSRLISRNSVGAKALLNQHLVANPAQQLFDWQTEAIETKSSDKNPGGEFLPLASKLCFSISLLLRIERIRLTLTYLLRDLLQRRENRTAAHSKGLPGADSPIPLPILNTSGNQWYWSNTNTTLDERVPPSVVLACSSSIAEIWWQLLKCWAKPMWTLSQQGWLYNMEGDGEGGGDDMWGINFEDSCSWVPQNSTASCATRLSKYPQWSGGSGFFWFMCKNCDF